MGLQRLKKLGKFEMEFFAVISEEEMIPLCEKYGVDWCMHENLPLGAKKNFGLQQAMKKDFDYLVEIGSDDLLKDQFLDIYSFDKDVFALSDFVMLNTEDGECRKLTKRDGYYGIGRAISRKCLERVFEKGKPGIWSNDLNQGLDNYSTFFLARLGFMETRVKSAEPVAIDLKSEVNIWSFQRRRGLEYSIDKALEGLSEKEITAIRQLCLVRVESESLIDR